MFNRDVLWIAFVSLSLLCGGVVLMVESTGIWGGFPSRPDWLWCLAFTAALGAPPLSAICSFAWCGLIRDMLLGPRPGAAAVAYILVGWITLYWQPDTISRGWLARAVAAAAGAFMVSCCKLALDFGTHAPGLIDRIFFVSLGNGLLTSLVFLPVAAVLHLPAIRPWRERTGLFS